MRVRLTKKRLLAILMLASAASSLASLAGPGWAARMRSMAQSALVPFADSGMFLTTTVQGRIHQAFRGRQSPEEAQRLEQERAYWINENDRLQRELQQHKQQIRELQNFRALYGPREEFPWELIKARVVMADSLAYGSGRVVSFSATPLVRPGLKVTERLILTDRSKALMPGELPAVSDSALVGRIVGSSAHTATLQLVTDAGFRCGARVFRDLRQPRPITVMPNARRETLTAENNVPIDVWVSGDGADGMIVRDVKKFDNVLPGDRLVTRDEDYYLPAQVAVGEVTEVTENAASPGFVTLKVRPHSELASLRNVYIVAPKPAEEGR